MNQKLDAIESMFTSKALSSLAKGDDAGIRNTGRIISGPGELSIRQVYDTAYDYLFKSGARNEYLYKNHIVLRHLLGRHSLETATILSEFRVGSAKADCVILNGRATCYEIKTNRDSLSRLKDQLDEYQKLFDEIYVVAGERHLKKLEDSLPTGIGILFLNSRGFFTTVREAKTLDKGCEWFDLDLVMNSLRKNEYVDLLSSLGANLEGIPNGKLYSQCRSLLHSYPVCDIKTKYYQILKKYRSLDKDFIAAMPGSLKGAVAAYKFTRSEIERLKVLFTSDNPW